MMDEWRSDAPTVFEVVAEEGGNESHDYQHYSYEDETTDSEMLCACSEDDAYFKATMIKLIRHNGAKNHEEFERMFRNGSLSEGLMDVARWHRLDDPHPPRLHLMLIPILCIVEGCLIIKVFRKLHASLQSSTLAFASLFGW